MARKNCYQALRGELEKKISLLPPETRLPSEETIAAEFGVSRPTLRRALAELAERGLIRKRNGIGSVVAGNASVIARELIFLCRDLVFFVETLKEFCIAATEANYLPSILPLSGSAVEQDRFLATAVARKPAGIVFYPDPARPEISACRQLVSSGIPLLFLIRLPDGHKGNLLSFESRAGVTGIVRRFYAEGCRRFALFGAGPVNPLAAEERTLDFFSGLKTSRLQARSEWICGRGASPAEQERFFDLFRTPGKAPDAVCCLNDFCAGTLIGQLQARGIDFSGLRVSGFDHSPATAFIPHPILTVEPPMRELGAEAASILIRRIENPEFSSVERKLNSKIVETKVNL